MHERHAISHAWIERGKFEALYKSMTNERFVDELTANARLTLGPAERTAFIDKLKNGALTRAQLLLAVVNNPDFVERESKRSIVLLHYFGYLRRDPDQGGYDFWLNILKNRLPNDSSGYRGMVCAFLTSAEYQLRFGFSVTRTNQDCSQ